MLHSVQPAAYETYPVFILNRRSWSLMATESFGPVIQTEIGALIVGGISNCIENSRVVRGSEKGHFELAGSTIVLLFNRLSYEGGRFLSKGSIHSDLSLPADSLVPFLPWTIVIYLGCFFWWGWVYWLIARQKRHEANRFFCAFNLAHLICLICFVAFPTTITRPVLTGETIWENLLAYLYYLDPEDNLFPSIHCTVSWLCFAGTRSKKYPYAIRIGSFLMVLLVCISVLTIKQHVIVDVAGGILLGEVCYQCCGMPVILNNYTLMMESLMGQFASSKNQEENIG